MINRVEIIKGIQECDLNGGLIGNCPYKEILTLLIEQERIIAKQIEIIKKADEALESIKEKINELLYEDFMGVNHG